MLLRDRGAASGLRMEDEAMEVTYNPDFYLYGSESQVVSPAKLQL